MRFLDFLKEAKSVGTLYHFTRHTNIESMADSGKIKSHTSHISLTRNYNLPHDFKAPNADFSYEKGYNTRITLDGDKISEHHKINPLLGVSANVDDPHNHKYNPHRVSRHEHENEENVKTKTLDFNRNHVKHVHVVPDSIEAINHYNEVIAPKLDSLGISHSIGRKFHRESIKEDSRKHESFLVS